MDTQLAQLVSQLGFPIVMALWFMVRLEKRWDRQLELLTQIVEVQRIVHEYITEEKKHG